MRQFAVIAFSGLLALPAAAADDAGATLTIARHHTSNALDNPRALDDWYSLLRGSVGATHAHDLGETSVTVEGELKRFDTFEIENDASVSMKAVTAGRMSDRVELRGSLSFGVVDEGSNIDLGETYLGTRTQRTMLEGSVQAGFQITPDTALVVEALFARERPIATRFEDELLPSIQLEPTRNWFGAGGKLTQTSGRFQYGAYATAGLKRSGPTALLSDFDVLDFSGGVQGGISLPSDAAIAASLGLHRIELRGTDFAEQRLAYQIVTSGPLPGGLILRGAIQAAYDLRTRDDPIAVWARSVTLDATYQPSQNWRISGGAFAEKRLNIAMETTDRAHGLFAEAAWSPVERVTLSFRVQGSKKLQVESGTSRRTLEVQIAASANL